jgi:hypothetical protein
MNTTTITPPHTFTQKPPAKDFCGVLDAPLLKLGSQSWTVDDACMGVLIMGATGSGKTSGSGAHLAHAYLRAGFGGLVLCAKPDERQRWEQYAKACGREHQLIIMDDSCKERFNFLEYSLHQQGSRSSFNLVTLFTQMAEAARTRKGGGSNADPYWQDAMKELLSHSIDALIAAEGTLRLHEVQKFVESIPTPTDERRDGFCMQTLGKAYQNPAHLQHPQQLELVSSYFLQQMRHMSDKTRGNIISSFTSLALPLMKGELHRLFCTDSTLVPELAHEGAIIIVDLPIKTHDMGGVLAAHIMKYLFQKATERRTTNAHTRPVFLWVDECQLFLSEYDQEFQSTARSSRAATVYLTQNISGIYSSIGGMRPQDTADALLGNLRTKIFHLNDNQATNQWAADMIGKQPMMRYNWGQNHSHGTSHSEGKSRGWSNSRGGGSNGMQSSSNYSYGSNFGTNTSHTKQQNHGSSHGASEQMDYRVQPSFFAERLRSGGQRNDCKVDGVLVQSGKQFDGTGQHWGLCSFTQELTSK